MSNENGHDAIYNQDDMNVVLAALRKAEKEAEHAKQLLWATVDAAGGEIAIPYSYWLDNEPVKELAMWDDPETYKMHLRTREVEDV
jgi:hypothetical protein